MPHTIDVTGLSPEAIRSLERLAEAYRKQATPPSLTEVPTTSFWSGPVPAQSTPEWLDWFYAWCASHPKREGVVEIDDDRGSIYDRDTE